MDLKGKCVLLGVSGGIAAYKMANVAVRDPDRPQVHGGHLRPGFQVRSHPYLAGKEGRRHPRGPGHRQRHCQDGSRHRRRYAYHRRSRGQVSQARLPCHEHRNAGEPHHPGQHRHSGKVRLHGHPLRERRTGLQGRGQRTPAERGCPAGLHLPRHRKAEGPRWTLCAT